MTDGVFVTDTEVDKHHARGVDLASGGRFYGAEDQLTEALDLIGVSETYEGDNKSAELHRARILRDLGFIPVRRRLPPGDRELEGGLDVLEQSLHLTDALFASVETGGGLREPLLLAEHGATKTFIGRYYTYEYLNGGSLEALEIAQNIFDEARITLREGNNTYYRTSNSMHAARAARLQGDKPAARAHMHEGFGSVKEAAQGDRRNLASAAKTFVVHQALLLAPDEAFRHTAHQNP